MTPPRDRFDDRVEDLSAPHVRGIPPETQRELGALNVRVSTCERRLDSLEDKGETTGKHKIADLEKQLAEMEKSERARLEREADKKDAIAAAAATKRWEIGKLVLAAVFAAAASAVVTRLWTRTDPPAISPASGVAPIVPSLPVSSAR